MGQGNKVSVARSSGREKGGSERGTDLDLVADDAGGFRVVDEVLCVLAVLLCVGGEGRVSRELWRARERERGGEADLEGLVVGHAALYLDGAGVLHLARGDDGALELEASGQGVL